MIAGHRKLANLTLIVDRNTLQQGARVADTNDLEPLADKFRAFGWKVIDADGHDPGALIDAFASRDASGKPLCVIAHTVKGKGVSYMEDQVIWHHGVPDKAQWELALTELGLVIERRPNFSPPLCLIAARPSPARLLPSPRRILESSSSSQRQRRLLEAWRFSQAAGRSAPSMSALPNKTWSASARGSRTGARFRS